MPRTFLKNIKQEIRSSLGRFFSILCIVAIGVAFFSGIKASAPDMKYSADQYFDKYHLQDIQLYSTIGFTKEDLSKIQNIKGVQEAQAVFSMEALTHKENSQMVIQVFSLPQEQKVNQVRLIEGRMPKAENECLIEATTAANQLFDSFEIGDTITLTSGTDDDLSRSLKNTSYTIVGTCYTPSYLSYEKGPSTIGSGSIDSFIYVPDSNIQSEYYTEIDVLVKGAKDLNSYSDDYFDQVDPVTKRIKQAADPQIAIRIQENQQKIDDAKAQLTKELQSAKDQINEGQKQLDAGYATLHQQEQVLSDAKAKLDQGWQSYYENVKVLDNLPTLENAIAQIEQGQAQLPDLQQKLQQVQTALDHLTQTKPGLQLIYDQTVANYDRLISIKNELEQKLSETPDDPNLQKQYDAIIAMIKAADYVIDNYYKVDQTIQQLQAANDQLVQGIAQIEQGLSQKDTLIQQRNQLLDAQSQLQAAYQTLVQSQARYDDGWMRLQEGKQTLQTKEQELNDAKSTLEKAEKENLRKIEEAQEELDSLEKKWIVLDRNQHYSYRDYGACADRMDGIAAVFPVFFFLVAALVCMTTMTRMVDEQRNEIGTLKALGYSKLQIASKYLIYAFVASCIGSLLGCIVGMVVFPTVIFKAWNTLYNLEKIYFSFQPNLILISSLSVIGITLLATIASIYKELIDVPSQLMRPKAGKAGKKILLEYVKPVWSKLSFLHKVTARNLFRYKKRFFMTIFGIAGCSALLVAGFGINDSISDIAHQQFDVIYQYDASIQAKNSSQSLYDKIQNLKGVQSTYYEEQIPVKTTVDGKEATITVHVIDDFENFPSFIHLKQENSDQSLSMNKNSILLSQKIANQLNIKPGDDFTFTNADNEEITCTISNVFENYVGHHLYVSRDIYNTWDSFVKTNKTYLIQTNKQTETYEQKLGEQVMNLPSVQGITFYSSLQENFDNMISSISIIVVVLVISAAALAFVVLYNLSNVNISERMREIATIKVLGFTMKEVSAYINREIIILTIIGSLLGLWLGTGLHHLIMNLAEMDDVMFARTILPSSFAISFILTICFAILVQCFMYRKLKKIQMVESLKAVE